jgi:carboxyl-terminal processing protease
MAQPGLIIYKTYGDFPRVLGVIKGSPAEKSGLRTGDVLSAIDNQNTLNMSLVEANLYLKGMKGKAVEFKVLRREDTYEMKVARAVLFPQPYSLTHEKNGLAVLTIHRLTPSTATGVREEILPGLKKNRTPLVIDLRHCSEGDFDEAQAFVNLFVRARSVGYFEKKGGIKRPVSSLATPYAPDLDLVVWVGPATMGAAEFVAGILQEVKKVKLIGLPTLGLVAKREHFRLKDGSSVLLTSEVFSLPSGRSLWERGIRPDERIEAGLFDNKAYIEKTLPFPPKR